MVESFLAVPLHFTVEFLGFLVFAGGAFLVMTRPGLIPGEISNRISVVAGFGLLAAAQVLHGGSFSTFETDGAQILVGARALGYAFVLIGIVGGLRTAGATASAAVGGWKLEEPLLLAPAGAALLVAAAALNGARSKDQTPMRRLALSAFLLSVSELLTATDPSFLFGAGITSGWAYAAHGVEALGFLMLAAWFWTGVRSSVRTRFVAAFAALLVAVVLALATALTGVISANVQQAELEDVRAQAKSTTRDLTVDETQRITNDIGEIATFVSDEIGQPGVGGQLSEFRKIFDLDFLMLMNPKGRIIAFDGDGPAKGKRQQETKLGTLDVLAINASPVIDTLVDNDPPTSLASSPSQVGKGAVALMSAHEVVSPAQPDRRIALVAGGSYIDSITMRGLTTPRRGPFASLVVQGRTVATQLPGKLVERNIVPEEVRVQVADGATVANQIVVGDRSYASSFSPIRDEPGKAIATLVMSVPAQVVVETRQGVTSVLFIVAMAVGAIALALAWFSGRRITRPIQLLTETAEAVREGNLQAEAPVEGQDEVGRLGETFNEMTASLFKMTNDLRDAAREEHDLRARIETIIQSMADALVAVDADKNVLAFNREAERMTGIETSAAMGRPVTEVLTTKDSHGQEVALPIYDLAAGSVDNVFLEPREGKPIPVTVVSAPLVGEGGEAAGGVLVMRDMTREREVERMKTEFLSNISHELRTPLTPIKGYAEILGRKDIPPDKAQKFVAGILESTSRLERIVHLLVDFSAMEAGRLSPKTTPIDISMMVEELATEWSKRSERHSVVTDIHQRVPQVVGDERLLRRSFEEVLDNALKFSPYGGTITLEVKEAAANNGGGFRDVVEVSISDEGIGIPADDIPRIFSDFHQLDGSETRTFGGLGLGLAFVQRIIEAHDGSVTVKSEPDHGTRLTIAIPAASDGE
jgi:two-component system sensor histidine kinase VicK